MSHLTNDSDQQGMATTSVGLTTFPPHGTLDLHTNTRWALVGFLVLSPSVSAMFLVVHLRMERKKTNILNIQLALVNFLSSVILLPMFFSFYQLFSMNWESFVSPWKQEDYVGTAFCGSLAITFYVLTSLHFTALFALSLDRMVAIHLPFKYRRIANSYYICGLATLWALTIVIPFLGFFVVLDDPILIGGKKVPRKLFQFLPHGIQNDQNVFCEIQFPTMVMDSSFDSKVFNPDTQQKVYCFFMVVVPYVAVPMLTVIVGIMTMFKIGVLDLKRKSLKYSKKERASLCRNFIRIIFKSNEIINPTNDVEMVYENRNHQVEDQANREMEGMAATLKKLPSKRRINTHFQALATVIMLMAFFCLCDALWWFFYVSYAFKYIFNMSFLSILGIFSSTEEQVIYPIIARFGIFIYSTFVPLLMIWRQKPLRDELLATLRIAKSRLECDAESEVVTSLCVSNTSSPSSSS
ncbi:hypothetical protein ACHWQZ_G017847 [Mnemiopsis leidyi]